MIYEIPRPPGAKLSPRTYTFLEPVQLRIRSIDGKITLMGYGIGDTVEVLEPDTVYLTVPWKRKKEIALADGSAIVEYPETMRYTSGNY